MGFLLVLALAFQRVNVPEDVPAHLVSAIAQDRQGLMWLGTQGGLVRYDGYDFRVFRSAPNDPTSIGGNYVRALLVASDGRVWAGSFSGGLSVFDPRTETFTRYQHDPADPRSLAYDRVEGLAEDREHRLWVATTAGVDLLDFRKGGFTHFPLDGARGLLVARDGVVWAGTRDGLYRYDGRQFEHVVPELAGQYVGRLYEDRRGRIWVGTEEQGASVLDPRDGSVRRIAPGPHGLSHYWVYGFAEGVGREMWIATFGGGVDVVDEETLEVVDRLRHDATLADTIGADRVGAIFRDRQGVMWIGTWGEGLARHDPRTRAFRSLRFSPNIPDGLTHAAAVRAMEMSDGRIWVGTNGNGIDILDRDLHRVGGFRPKPDDAGALADGAITCLAQSRDGTIWVATLNSMLHRLRPGSSRFDRIAVERLPGGPIRTIAFDRNGVLWAGAAEGMARVDPETLATRVFRRWPGAAKSSPAIESIAIAANGLLWVGSDNGLYTFDPLTEKPSRVNSVPGNWIPDLMFARDGRLWLATSSGAAVMADGRFEVLTTQPAEAVIEDADGFVWVGPRLRIDPRGSAMREFGPSEGCAFRNFFIASRARMRDGRLLFGSPEGLLVLDPRALPADDVVPDVIATALRVEGRPRAGAPVLRALELSPSQRSFSLDLTTPGGALAKRGYRYRMDGLEEEWSTTGATQRSIAYSRLPPGRYTLRVGLANHRSHELRLPVTVLPAFYQTRWFRALVVLLTMLLLYVAYRLRVRRLRARERELERLVAERTRELEDAYVRIEEASLTDPLTKLRNRRFLEQAIPSDLELASRGHGDLVVLLADLDHFKSVNDTYGHAAGDAVLVALADVMRRTFRASDWIVRWGGEEFLVVVRFVDGNAAPELAEKLRAAVEAAEFVLPGGALLRKTCSIGVAVWPHDGQSSNSAAESWERVVDLADAALYEAKRGGRNQWQFAPRRVIA